MSAHDEVDPFDLAEAEIDSLRERAERAENAQVLIEVSDLTGVGVLVRLVLLPTQDSVKYDGLVHGGLLVEAKWIREPLR